MPAIKTPICCLVKRMSLQSAIVVVINEKQRSSHADRGQDPTDIDWGKVLITCDAATLVTKERL